ncbi:hypothetical protein A3L09_03565 [Thermococcus profundus]|uniref:FAD/NAD(P)-binding domain-containing protein n=1 Tax=Thermococcus profundus TaxID=49899 RepID=A0A2Z2MEP4_THEPR|nr:FAD-dependent oxidoreductase [Thermococcus profundus]ASJ02394.1 hypothetical protein A3L09_03565 [Thermococcus profundus]
MSPGGTVIIGGGVGGIYTAMNLIKEGVEPGEITLIAREWPPYTRHRLAEFLALSAPFDSIALRLAGRLQTMGVNVLEGAEALSLNPKERRVTVRLNGRTLEVSFTNLVIATGGRPAVPPIPGVNLKGVISFHGVEDVEFLESLPAQEDVVVIGAGLVGLTAAVAMRRRGQGVTVVEARERVLPGLIEPGLSEFVEEYLRREGLEVLTSTLVKRIEGRERVKAVELSDGGTLNAGAVVLATGVRPNSALLRDDGRTIEVDGRGETAIPGVYALGDCALSRDFVTGKFTYRPLGFVAAHYARVVARAITGKPVEGRGVIPTIYEKIGRLDVYKIGLGKGEAEGLGLSTEVEVYGGKKWAEANLFDLEGRLVGWQRVQVGHFHSTGSANAYLAIRGILRDKLINPLV